MAGAYDIVVAAGVEVMSVVPMGASAMVKDVGFPFGETMGLRYADVGGLVPQGISAEMIAEKWGLSREDLDAFGALSQQRAEQAAAEGRFDNEIIPVQAKPRDKETGELIADRRDAHPSTRASAPAPPSRRWPTSSRRSSPTAWSPPATRRRSPTAPRPC